MTASLTWPRQWAARAWERLPHVDPTVPELLAVLRQVPRRTTPCDGVRRSVIAYLRVRYQHEAHRRRRRAA
jgi:hypothetical protein